MSAGVRALAEALLVGGLALGARLATWPTVFTPEGVLLYGNDAWYHLRRIVYSVHRFPDVLSFDRFLNYPEGGHPIWTPAFDLGVAALALLAGAGGDDAQVERLAAWVPPVLGAAAACATWAVGRRLFSPGVGVVAGLLVAVLPAHWHYSQIGFVDHHALIALCGAGLLAAGVAYARTAAGTGSTLALAAAIATAFLAWPGCLLHIAGVDVGLVATGLARERGHARWFGRLAAAHAAAAAAVAPFALADTWPLWGPFSPVVLSRFQPWLLGLGAVLFGLTAGLAQRRWLGARAPVRFAVFAAAGAALAALALLLTPGILDGADQAATWLGRGERFQAGVRESRPLFLGTPAVDLSAAVWLAPILLPLVLWRERRDPAVVVWLLFTAVLAAAALAQQRFANSLAIPWALLLAHAVWRLPDASPRARGALRAAAVLALLLALLPCFLRFAPPLANLARVARGEPARPSQWLAGRQSLVRTAAWLRAHSEDPGGFLDATVQPAWAVMSGWSDGHVIEYVARRPTVVSNFGDDVGPRNLARMGAYFAATSEAEGLAILAELGARFVLTRDRRQSHGPRATPGDLFDRLAGPGAAERLRSSPEAEAGLAQHRLRYRTRRPAGARAALWPEFRLFEIVEGAWIEGRTEPGAVVEVSLSLVDGDARAPSETWRVRAHADARGAFAVRVPYSTEPVSGVRTDGPVRVRAPGLDARVRVGERAVRSGGRVAVASPIGVVGEAMP